MKKVALTVWGDRISPVFDSANTLLIVEIENKQAINRHLESFNSTKPSLLMERLIEQKVSVLICGAISEFPAHLIENSRLRLIPFITGNVDKIIDKYMKGASLVPTFSMPGCGSNRRKCCAVK
jgi:predicted Fe-Mo cluster-binding NifX family protein